MTTLTTHVLDLGRGEPAAGIGYALYALEGASGRLVAQGTTNQDGRTDAPLATDLGAGHYEIVFGARAYFTAAGRQTFYDDIPIRFTLDAERPHHHVPLLLSPWGYSTYRGS
jgi:hydroxyisourate hydrolase